MAKEEEEGVEAVGGGEGAGHEFIGGVIERKGRRGGGGVEEVEVVRAKAGVVEDAAEEGGRGCLGVSLEELGEMGRRSWGEGLSRERVGRWFRERCLR